MLRRKRPALWEIWTLRGDQIDRGCAHFFYSSFNVPMLSFCCFSALRPRCSASSYSGVIWVSAGRIFVVLYYQVACSFFTTSALLGDMISFSDNLQFWWWRILFP